MKTTWTFDYKSKENGEVNRFSQEFEDYASFLYSVRKFKIRMDCDVRVIVKTIHESTFKWNEEIW